MQLVIGNKNYSSWSMRPWVLMRQLGIPFDERKLPLSYDAGSEFKRQVAQISPAGNVPVLVEDDGFAVWDTLAITEYLHDRFPDRGIWPADAKARAEAFGVKVVPLPSPGRIERDGEIVPASHMNFYIGNAAVVVPLYGGASDTAAVAAVEAAAADEAPAFRARARRRCNADAVRCPRATPGSAARSPGDCFGSNLGLVIRPVFRCACQSRLDRRQEPRRRAEPRLLDVRARRA